MNDTDRFPTLYAGPRKSGKTTRIIQHSSRTGIPILCHSTRMKDLVERTAQRGGFANVKVITMRELEQLKIRPDVLIEETQLLIEEALKVRVKGAAFTTADLNVLEYISRGEAERYNAGEEQGIEPPLLSIEVKDMHSVPVVKYKGKDISGRIQVNYEWATKDLDQPGVHRMQIKHAGGMKDIVNTISHERLTYT